VMILLALHLHSLQVGIEFEGQMTLKGTEASAPDVPPDGVRREPQKGRLPNGRTTGPAHRSSKGNWTAEEMLDWHTYRHCVGIKFALVGRAEELNEFHDVPHSRLKI